MISIEMTINIKPGIRNEIDVLTQHPLLQLPYIKWSKCCDCLGHINVLMDDDKEYEFRGFCLLYDITIHGDRRYKQTND